LPLHDYDPARASPRSGPVWNSRSPRIATACAALACNANRTPALPPVSILSQASYDDQPPSVRGGGDAAAGQISTAPLAASVHHLLFIPHTNDLRSHAVPLDARERCCVTRRFCVATFWGGRRCPIRPALGFLEWRFSLTVNPQPPLCSLSSGAPSTRM
jgi:hypothetical protein